jgi:hypothetical protein
MGRESQDALEGWRWKRRKREAEAKNTPAFSSEAILSSLCLEVLVRIGRGTSQTLSFPP